MATTAQGNEVTVHVGASGFRADVAVRGHEFVADEPRSYGGTDEGPTPYDYLVAALGTCTAMTVRLYADRRGWPLDSVTVRLTHSRVHAQDCQECEAGQVGLDQIARSVELTGDLAEEQRVALLRVAERCPVGQTLTRGVRVVAVEPPGGVPAGG